MMCGEGFGVDDVDVGLGELAIAALLRTLTPPDLLDLVAPKGKNELMGVLQHISSERHGEIEMQTKISRSVLAMQPLHGVDLLVDLALLGQTIQWLDRPSLDGCGAVQFEGLSQPVQHELFDDPSFRGVLRKAGQRLGATHATPCCQPAAERPEAVSPHADRPEGTVLPDSA